MPHLHIAPATVDLSGFELEVGQARDRAFRLRTALGQINDPTTGPNTHTYVLIDCQPALRKPPAPPEKPLRTWRIRLIRAKGQYLGRVEAPDEESAIKAAIEHFDIDQAHRSRLIAELVE